jgi:hypothetical protein
MGFHDAQGAVNYSNEAIINVTVYTSEQHLDKNTKLEFNMTL